MSNAGPEALTVVARSASGFRRVADPNLLLRSEVGDVESAPHKTRLDPAEGGTSDTQRLPASARSRANWVCLVRKSFHRRPMRHNSFRQSTCPLCRSGEELALFGAAVSCLSGDSSFSRSTWLCGRARQDWVRFARFGPAVTAWAALRPLPTPACTGELALFGAIATSVAGASGHAVWHLSRPVQGKLGSFGATSPSGGSADAFAGPRPSLSIGKLGLFVPAVATTTPPATLSVGVRSCRSGRIGFVSHAFVRSTAFTRIEPVFPAPRRYSQRSKIASGISGPLG